MRWVLILQAYDFINRYQPGKDHQNADGLSRQYWPGTMVDEDMGVGASPEELTDTLPNPDKSLPLESSSNGTQAQEGVMSGSAP